MNSSVVWIFDELLFLHLIATRLESYASFMGAGFGSLDYSALAQLVEQLTVNQRVAGSSPAGGAIFYNDFNWVLVSSGKGHHLQNQHI